MSGAPNGRPFRLVLLLFFASGLSALTYELLWGRLLALVLGNTVEAAATTLAAFMAGLALGSLVLGTRIDALGRHPLRVYAALEAGLGACALVLPALFSLPVPLYRRVYGVGGGLLPLARFAVSFALLLVPTTLMGGTLPVLARYAVRDAAQAGRRLGALYAANTLGGAAGALLAGFVLIPALGPRATNVAAAALSVLVSLLALGVSRGEEAPRGIPRPAEGRPEAPIRAVLYAYAALGFAGLALEVVWTRALLLVFGSTTYSFTVMLATFLIGLALGSALIARRADSSPAPATWLGALMMVCALTVLATAWIEDALPEAYLGLVGRFGLTWRGDTLARSLIAMAVMLPSAVLFGMAFPWVARLEVRRLDSIGRSVGRLYAANTLGAIAGSLAGGFVLLPLLGLERSVLLMGGGLALAGALTLLRAGEARFRAAIALSLLGAAALVGFGAPRWDPKRLSAGVYMAPGDFLSAEPGGLRRVLSGWRLLEYKEGRTETVAVLEAEGVVRSLRVDGKSEITTLEHDRRLGRLMGHIPALLHENPRVALNIGLGAGFTVAALASHPLDRIDVAEIEPQVARVNGAFASENHGVLSDPRVHLVFNDGRNQLLLAAQRYDVITSDPFEPTVAGAASLFTREHFALGRGRLAPGGLMCQYLPLYEVGRREYAAILKAFASVFPHVTGWFTGHDTVLVGSVEPVVIDFGRLSERLSAPRVRADLEDVSWEDPYRFLGSYVFSVEGGGTFDPAIEANSDDHPEVEFAAPKIRWLPNLPSNLRDVLAHKRALPEGVGYPSSREGRRAEEVFRAETHALEALLAWESGEPERARDKAEAALALDAGDPVAAEVLVGWHQLVARSFGAGREGEAIREYEAALQVRPGAWDPLLGLATSWARLGDLDRAEEWVARALAGRPHALRARVLGASLARRRGRSEEAERELRGVLQDFPDDSAAALLLAEVEDSRGHRPEAEARVRRALDYDPRDARAHLCLARLAARTGRGELALEELRLAVRWGGAAAAGEAEADPVLRTLHR